MLIEDCLALWNLSVPDIMELLPFILNRGLVVVVVVLVYFFNPCVFLSLPLLLQIGQLDKLVLEPKYNRLFFKKKI